MRLKQFKLIHVFLAIAICAVGFWFSMPASKFTILIAPDKSLRLDGTSFDSEQKFWETFRRDVEYCRAWQMKPNVEVRVSANLSHVPIVGVVLALSSLGIKAKTVLYVDVDTGELLDRQH